jgi:Flp pilus assembly protein TadD
MSDFDRALADHRAGRHEAAAKVYRRLIDENPEHADAWHLLGLSLHQRGQNELAVPTIRRALLLNPRVANYHNSLGLALHATGDNVGAVKTLQTAVLLDRNDAEAHNNLGMVYTAMRSFEAAERALEKALRIRPDHHGAIYNLGRNHVWLGNDAKAVMLLRDACNRDPDNPIYWNTYGVALVQINEYDAGRGAFERAISIDPEGVDPHVNLAQSLLRDGNFEKGWVENEWRLRRREFEPRMREEPWRGEDIRDRTILLWSEQGLGDAIQFVRYAPLVSALGARVIVEAPIELHALFGAIEGVSEVVARGVAPERDTHAALMSLPANFGARSSVLPYLHAPNAAVRGDGMRKRIGLVWAGNPAHSNDHHRSHELKSFAPLAQSDIEFFALQKGPSASAETPAGMSLTRLGDGLNDFSDTAAVLAGLDLLISVDTSVAHLAGAMGIPTWLILPACPDWRWGREGETTVWYPSVRLFRQVPGERVGAVFERLAKALDPG